VNFRQIRELAQADLFLAGIWDSDPGFFTWRACGWHPETGHQAVCCNLISNLDTLADLLTNGTWCDEVSLNSTDDGDAERLFRYYGLAFLCIDQCVMDLRVVSKALGSKRLDGTLKQITGSVMASTNRIWKHRDRADASGRMMHRDHHHGPYVFADAGPVDHVDGLLVPSLPDAVNATATSVLAVEEIVGDDRSILDRLHAEYPPQTA